MVRPRAWWSAGSAWWRCGFVVYALGLMTATHWPRLAVNVAEIERPDLILHAAAFGGWCVLLNMAGWVRSSCIERQVVIVGLISLAYAGVDEGTQGIEWFGRTCAWDDYAADVSGIVAATVGMLVYVRLLRKGLNSGSVRMAEQSQEETGKAGA